MEPETGMLLMMAAITICLAAVVNVLMLKRRVSEEQEKKDHHLHELTIGRGALFIVVAVLIAILYTGSGVPYNGASISQAAISPGDFITLTWKGGNGLQWQSKGQVSYKDTTEPPTDVPIHGNFLQTILHILYQYLLREEPNVTYREVLLKVQDPIAIQAYSMALSDSSVVAEWRRWAQEVMRLGKEPRDVHLQFTGTASLTQHRMLEDNISLVLKKTHHVDQGLYLCFFMKDKDISLATEINVTGKVTLCPNTAFVKVGEEVDLLCFGSVDWFGTEAEFVQWKMEDQVVLQWEKGSQSVGSQFTDRASLSKERILQNNICLMLKNISHADQGLYQCLFVKDQTIRQGTQMNLTVTDHMTWLEMEFGSSVLLPLHSVSPVIVRFLPDGVKHPVQVCEIEKGQVKCGAPYSHRTGLYNQSLELKNLCMEDSGTFSVMERETQHTVSVIFIHVLPPGAEVSRKPAAVLIIAITLILLTLVATLVIIMRRWRRRRLLEEQEVEIHHQNRDVQEPCVTKSLL